MNATAKNFCRLISWSNPVRLLLLAMLSLPCTVLTQLPAFPGAEGFGGSAIGGRFGDVYHVTDLSSDAKAPGSFAYALATVPQNGRTIVFDVSGYIPINGKITLNRDKVTIAGQTAPGDGIGFQGGTFLISASDVVIRHVRFRNGRSADTINLDSRATNCIMDHCDVLLGKDENLSSFRRPADNFTFQWSINGWGLETHSAGGLWDFTHATSHHSLWTHNHTRNPKARSVLLDWINNITFDYDIGFIMGDSASTADWKANVIGSWFICPPGNLHNTALEKARLMEADQQPNFSLHITDSVMDANGDGILNVSKSGYAIASGNYRTNATPFKSAGIPVMPDDQLTAYKKVLSAVGPLRLCANSPLPLRDDVDSILIGNVTAQKKHHVSNAAATGASNGGYGVLSSAPIPPDTDRDGMPDFWEIALDSNPRLDDHTNAVPTSEFIANFSSGKYTLLEEYLHFRATPHGYMASGKPNAPTALEVDLHRYTTGFTNVAPVNYFVHSAVNGKASIVDKHIARFEPSVGFTGRASFNFRVSDGDNRVWDQSFFVLVTNSAAATALR